MFPINFPAALVAEADPVVWKACAGDSYVVPEVGSVVYYFPEGHAEQRDSTPVEAPPIFRCRVLNVRFLADRASDEVFAAVLLQQAGNDFRGASPTPASRSVGFGGGGEVWEGPRVVSCMKTVTQSDANNGGGFSVKKGCAESIFPPLNYRADPPVQNLKITDVQGVDWVFRHIFRGTPKRHLLTTGWSKFVNHKKLIAGDSVIFMRDKLTERLYIGIRRLDNGDNCRRFGSRSRNLGGVGGSGDLRDEVDEGFWRSGDIRASARFIEKAVFHASQGKPFEIILNPWSCLSDFLMDADVVDRALRLRWALGMTVKMRFVEKEDESSKPLWLRGHVSRVLNSQENGHWLGSPWKMLQVTWVEPEHLQNVERVSPWQVECIGPSVPLPPIHSSTELRGPNYIQPLVGSNREPHSMIEQMDQRPGLLNLALFNSNTHLASMQGARHLSDVSVLMGGDTHQIRSDDMFQRSELSLFGSRITESNPGGHLSSNFSPESHSSMRSFDTEIGNMPSPQDGINSFQLFGKLIYVNSPVESQSGDGGCLETESINKSDNDNETSGLYNQSCVH